MNRKSTENRSASLKVKIRIIEDETVYNQPKEKGIKEETNFNNREYSKLTSKSLI